MIYIDIFLLLNLALSLYLIFQHRLLNAIIAEGIISSLSAALFFLLKAPDIAITQIAIGSGFLTFLFIVSIKIKEKILVGYSEESLLVYTMSNKYYGISVEVLEKFFKMEGFEKEYKKIDRMQALKLIKDGDIDVYISSENENVQVPKIPYLKIREVMLKRNKGFKSVKARGVNDIVENIKNGSIKEIKTILTSLITIRNKLKDFEVVETGDESYVYLYLNPYNTDLIDLLKKFIKKHEKDIEETVEKYV